MSVTLLLAATSAAFTLTSPTQWNADGVVTLGNSSLMLGKFTAVLFDKDGRRTPLRAADDTVFERKEESGFTVLKMKRSLGRVMGRTVDTNFVGTVETVAKVCGERLSVQVSVTPRRGCGLYSGPNGASQFSAWLLPLARERLIGWTVEGSFKDGTKTFEKIVKGYRRGEHAIDGHFLKLAFDTPRGAFVFDGCGKVSFDLSRYSEQGIELYASKIRAFEDRGWSRQPWTESVRFDFSIDRTRK